MMDKEKLDSLSAALGIKPQVLEADIKELAWSWDEVVREMGLTNPERLLLVLSYLCRTYLRGRNVRMGNYQGIWRHIDKKAAAIMLTIEHVTSEQYCFESLHKAGVTSVIRFRDAILGFAEGKDYNVLNEVKQFLEEEEQGR